MSILIIDLEATCDQDNRLPRHQMEIIEIGAIMLDQQFNPVSEFQTLIKPLRQPRLTEFCTELTGIKQQMVDSAPSIFEVFPTLVKWLKAFPGCMHWASWGAYDFHQFNQDALHFGLENPVAVYEHINLKPLFGHSHGIRRMGLGRALDYLSLEFEGSHHRGLDDVRNIVRIIQQSKPFRNKLEGVILGDSQH